MAALDIVGTGQPTDHPILELHAEMGGGPDGPAGSGRGKALHRIHIAAEIAHDVDRVRVQGLDLEIGRAFRRVLDPHAHIDKEQMSQLAFILPSFGQPGGRGKAVVQVDAIAKLLFAGLGHHLLRFGDLIADRFFPQNMAAGLQSLHGGQIVIAAVFIPTRGDAAHVRMQAVQHLLRIIKSGHAQAGSGRICPVFLNITHPDQFGQGIGLIHISMAVADRPHANHTGS